MGSYRAMACGYIYVVSHPDMGKTERKVGGSLYHPFDLTARWERAGPSERPLRLHSMAFVSDITRTRAYIADRLQEAKAAAAKAGAASLDRVQRDHVAEALRAAIAHDHDIMLSGFDRHTGLLLNPSERLSGPPARLVKELSTALGALPHAQHRNLFREPYSIGLLWSLIELRVNQLHIPTLYVPEIYRALSASLWGARPSNTDMRDVLTIIRRRPAEYRLGRYEFSRFIRGPMSKDALAPEAIDRLRAFVQDPAHHMGTVFQHYAKTNYTTAGVRLLGLAGLLTRSTILALLLLLIEIVMLGTGPEAALRGLTTGFLIVSALFALNFFEKPDAPRMLGLISERDWRVGLRNLRRLARPDGKPITLTAG